jgi:hypothetical protein
MNITIEEPDSGCWFYEGCKEGVLQRFVANIMVSRFCAKTMTLDLDLSETIIGKAA